ncbi:hypothetical protein ERX46_06365 [Brumimicrobium glaciale]|uniref:Uncharacterized protein n=1 Tax=Brumimicrobium glaciale TaxID=200475 RepID=A0A4Q4KNG9_9FLAO|nr:hypothetical protein [Brumimicrobium glaciale]RYM34993.1 hypothetical protein ERX46_06365 [Brumimicrobium glaciale]
MAFILDLGSNKLIKVEIISASGKMPTKKDGWKFDWKILSKEKGSESYVLRLKDTSQNIEGILQLKVESNMLIMDVIEIAPHNLGSTNKRYDFVAGCLIAFACRESLKMQGDYRGFVTFTSKTNLISWCKSKYGATQAIGQRMYIDDVVGLKLINKYLY